MKKIALVLSIGLIISSCNNNPDKQNNSQVTKKNRQIIIKEADTTDKTNDFYDNAETYALNIKNIDVTGEIENPGKVDFSGLPLHSVIVKETLLDEDGNSFVGAYRYDGYSLYDILNKRVLKKKNRNEFKPIIDLYVEVENDSGEKVLISWGEIFYPNHLHEIIVATNVMRIVPSKTKELWELPVESKLIISSDLITERNITNPNKITVKSYKKSFKVERGKQDLYSSKIDIFNKDKIVETLYSNPEDLQIETFNTIFYGRGRGIHSTQPFKGVLLKKVLGKHFKPTKENLQKGLFAVVADDGYRVVFTYSEICNRNDQSEILLICNPEVKEDGIFRIFPCCDFFSDRAVKAINEIYFCFQQD
jgi:hypothetical protein